MSPNFFHTTNDLLKLGIKAGKNCKVHSTVMITEPRNLVLGNNVRIDSFTSIVSSSKVKIESFIHIGSHVLLHAGQKGIELKKYCGVSSGVKIFSSTDDYTGKNFFGPYNKNSKNDTLSKKIVLKKYCIIGTNSVVIPNAEFGEGSVIGALSLASKKLEKWSIYFGQPLKYLMPRSKKFIKKIK